MKSHRFLRVSLLACVLTSALSARAEVIFDQLGPNSGSALHRLTYASQVFEPGLTDFNIIAVDDFTTTEAYRLTRLDFGLQFWGSPQSVAAITGYHVAIYNFNGGTPIASLNGDAANLDLAPSEARTSFLTALDNTVFRVSLDLSGGGVTLASGTYFIGVAPNYPYSTNGQTAVFASSLSDNSKADAHQINPTGAFGIGTNPPLPGVNLSYRLEGNVAPVPEPGSLTILGLGALGLRRRRRRG